MKLVLTALAVSAVSFAAADVVNRDRYHPVSEPVSRYVNGTAGWLTTVAILSLGLASALVVRLVRGKGRWVLAAWAGGVLIAGVFPADPPGRYDQPSVSEMVHGTAAWVAFAAFPVAALLLSRRSGMRVVAVASALLTLVFAVFMADVMDGPSLGFGGEPTALGLAERLLIAANLIWLALAAATAGRGENVRHADVPAVRRVHR